MQFQLSDTNMDIMNSSTSDSERLSVVDSATSNPTSQTPQKQMLKEHRHQSIEGDNNNNNNNKTAEEHNKQHQGQEAEAELNIIGLIVEHDADATSDDICFDISMGIERFHQSEIILEDDVVEGEEGDDACDQKDADMDDCSQQEFEIPLPPQDEVEDSDDDDDENKSNGGGAILAQSLPSCSVLLRQAQSRSSSDLTDDSDSNSNGTGMLHNGDRRSLLTRNKANSVAAIKCCTTRRAFSDHDAIILSNIEEDDEEEDESTNDDFEMSLTRMSMDHQRRYTGSSSSYYSNRRQSNDSYASAYSTRGRRRSSMASTQSGTTTASGGRARRRTSRRMSTECHDSLILDELSAMMADATMRREQATKSKCNPNDGSVDTIATAASSASTFRRPSMLASAIENNDFYQRQPVANEDLYAYDGHHQAEPIHCEGLGHVWRLSTEGPGPPSEE